MATFASRRFFVASTAGGLGTCLAAHQTRSRRPVHAEPASFKVLAAYAADQRGEVAAGRGPRRQPEIDERYARYFRWAEERGHSGAEYIVLTAQWRSEYCGPTVALEPNIVAYELETGIEHWNLWYHPRSTPGTADLDLQVGAVVELVGGVGKGCKGRIRAVRSGAVDSEAEDAAEHTFDVSVSSAVCADYVAPASDASPKAASAPTGSRVIARVQRSHLKPCGYEAVFQHVRFFLPQLTSEEVVIFQNVPEFRSVPEVAHAHVFIRPVTEDTREELRRLREAWRLRSPWAEHERLTGRAGEVGFAS